jgi:hypothetical protein
MANTLQTAFLRELKSKKLNLYFTNQLTFHKGPEVPPEISGKLVSN